MSVRVRFAPSPTGKLHVGALRAALYNHLFAQKHGGVNILRIEDTDRTRYNAESEKEFIDTLRWTGIEFHEGPHTGGPFAPYRQSERKEAGIYAPLVQELIDKGSAYYAFETSEELDEMRQFQQINKMATGYFGGEWRDASPEKVAEAFAAGKEAVVRLKIPRGRSISYECPIRGRLEWESDVVDDPVLLKKDGMPTYHFAAMVDDHLMEITHTLRGDEWIPSLPKHLILFEAFGWETPIFVHCPVIVGNDGKKLSKRHGATRVLDYAAQGYLPEPLKNFIALIGWSPGGDQELMSPEELVANFGIEGIQPSPGKFDLEKLNWMNGNAIRAFSAEELVGVIEDYWVLPSTQSYFQADALEDEMPEEKAVRQVRFVALGKLIDRLKTDREFAIAAILLEQERVSTLAEFGVATEFFLVDEVEFDEKAVGKAFQHAHTVDLLSALAESIGTSKPASAAEYDALIHAWASENGFEKLGPVVAPIRVAMTGKMAGPGLFDLMSVLGAERVVARLNRAIDVAKTVS